MKEWENTMFNYLSGNLGREDREVFEKKLSTSEDLRREFLAYSEIWDLTGLQKHPDNRTDFGWENFKATVKAPKRKLGFDWLKVAASIVLFAAFSVGIYTFLNESDSHYTSDKERVELMLKDQSHIQLNALSTLTEEEGFGKTNRRVSLEGEAYFEVKPSEIPFLLSVAEGTVKVVGTQFNVLSIKEEQYLSVELYEGRVDFESAMGKITQLVPGQRLIINNGDVLVSDIQNTEANWLSNPQYISCTNVPLRQIMLELNRNYGVEYKLPKNYLHEYYTAVLPRNDLDGCLTILSKIANLTFILDDNVIRVQ